MRSCFSVGGIEIDRVVARRFLELVSPAGLEAARAAAQAVAERAETALRNQQLEIEHCRYEAGLAERRHRKVDPDNRLIAAAREQQPEAPPPSFFADLGTALERVWDAPETAHRDRK